VAVSLQIRKLIVQICGPSFCLRFCAALAKSFFAGRLSTALWTLSTFQHVCFGWLQRHGLVWWAAAKAINQHSRLVV
jgi:hypothetical protein